VTKSKRFLFRLVVDSPFGPADFDGDGERTSASKLLLRRVASVVCNYADPDGTNAYPSVQTLADDTGASRRSVQNALSVLVLFGWLGRVEGGRGPRDTHVYELLIPAEALTAWRQRRVDRHRTKGAVAAAKGALTANKGAVTRTKDAVVAPDLALDLDSDLAQDQGAVLTASDTQLRPSAALDDPEADHQLATLVNNLDSADEQTLNTFRADPAVRQLGLEDLVMVASQIQAAKRKNSFDNDAGFALKQLRLQYLRVHGLQVVDETNLDDGGVDG
jgi:hypothetical protein